MKIKKLMIRFTKNISFSKILLEKLILVCIGQKLPNLEEELQSEAFWAALLL